MHPARKILFPLSLLYGGITQLRNKLYNKNIIKSYHFDLPIICVGNLSVGGTGKSPMIEYLVSLLKEDMKLATLSRGYKRATTGFYLLKGNENAADVGDEPLQFKTKFPEIKVAVDEKRVRGIQQLLQLNPPPEVILLDDAFQHRKVAAGLNILLTSHQNLYYDDQMLPSGNLREPKSGAKRAQIIVVTKCPANIENIEKNKISKKLKLTEGQELYFSTIGYSERIFNTTSSEVLNFLKNKKFILVTGIANPQPLVQFLTEKQFEFEHLKYPDHHNFTHSEIEHIEQHLIILTTEKDFMRLKSSISTAQLFYIPIKMAFLEGKKQFDHSIKNYLLSYKN